jgi:hypothetical protein
MIVAAPLADPPRCAPLRPRSELVELVDANSRPDCSSIVRVHGGFQSRERAPLSRAARNRLARLKRVRLLKGFGEIRAVTRTASIHRASRSSTIDLWRDRTCPEEGGRRAARRVAFLRRLSDNVALADRDMSSVRAGGGLKSSGQNQSHGPHQRASALRKRRTFANGVVSGSNRPRAEVPSVRTDLRRPPEAGIPRRPRDRQPLTQSGKLPRARRWTPASTAAVVARRSLMAPRSISQFIGSQSGWAAPSGLSQSRPANSLASASMNTRTFAARC